MDEEKKPQMEIPMTIPSMPAPKKPLLSPLTQIDAQLGFLIGTLVGVLGADICIIAFIDMSIWIKVFTAIGGICVVGTLALGIYQAWSARKAFLFQQNQLAKLKEMFNAAANNKDQNYIG